MRRWIGCGVVALGFLVLVVGLMAWMIAIRSDLVRKEVAVEGAWARLENVYRRRLDLVLNLVETVGGATDLDRGPIRAAAEARSRASRVLLTPEMLGDPARMHEFEQTQNDVSKALSDLLAAASGHPRIRENESLGSVESQLDEIGTLLEVERRRFDGAVRDYNTAIRVFPGSAVARLFSMSPKTPLEAGGDG